MRIVSINVKAFYLTVLFLLLKLPAWKKTHLQRQQLTALLEVI